MATIRTLLDGVTATGPGPILKLDPAIWKGGGSLPILISGITSATVTLEATLATETEILDGSAMWVTVSLATWTADVADGLFTPYTHVRGRVTVYAAGTIYMKTLV